MMIGVDPIGVTPIGVSTVSAGYLSKTQDDNTLSASGALSIAGSVSATQAGDTLSASAALAITGSVSATAAGDSLTAAGTVAQPSQPQGSSGARYATPQEQPSKKKKKKLRRKIERMVVSAMERNADLSRDDAEIKVLMKLLALREDQVSREILRQQRQDDEAIALLLLAA